jgi:inorganic pyrophosphatase
MTHEHRGESLEQAREYLGTKVKLVIDRPLGSSHPEHGFYYSVNYGYIPNTIAPDGEGIDAYFLGVNEPVDTAEGLCIAIIHRLDDNDDSLIVVPEDLALKDEEIKKAVGFQEQFFDFKILRK